MNKLSQYKQRKKEHDGYCTSCQRPSLYLICSYCKIDMIKSKNYDTLTFKDIGLATINYQQHLHRRFFKCNAPVAYRGEEHNRIRTKVKDTTIDKAVHKLHTLLTKKSYTIYSRTFQVKTDHNKLYSLLQPIVRNLTKRILYNMVLYYIAYYKYNTFENDEHFKYLSVHKLHNFIENEYMRNNKTHNIRDHNIGRASMRYNYIDYIHESLSAIVKPIIYEIIDTEY